MVYNKSDLLDDPDELHHFIRNDSHNLPHALRQNGQGTRGS